MLEIDTNAVSELADTDFLLSVALVVVGTVLADVVTAVARANIVDLQMPGADAVYAFLTAALAITVLPYRVGKPIALGSAAGGAAIAAEEFGVFEAVGLEGAA